MKDQWTEQKIKIADELLESFEVAAEWPDFYSFADICDDHSVNPSKELYHDCINIASVTWSEIKIKTKNSLNA